MKPLASLLLLISVAASHSYAQTPQLPEGTEAAARQISRASLEAPIRFLSDDLLEGRGPATRGDELARLYLTRELQSLGLRPGGPNGSWQQPFDIVGVATSMPPQWSFRGRNSEVSLTSRQDFILGSGRQEPHVSVKDAELVFVGYGINAPEFKWDDYKGADLRGKIFVMMNNDPDWDPKLFAGSRRLYYGRWSYKYEEAARRGAAGVIIIHTTPSAGYPWSVVQSSWSGEQFELPAEKEPRLQFRSWTTEEAMQRIVKSSGLTLDKLIASARSPKFKPVALGVTTSLDLQPTVTKKTTANVAGLLEGSDPTLSHEVLIYSAHHDHLGIGQPDASGDKIHNGALDNASGCGQVLAIARAFTALPNAPKRSVLFLFVAGEEQGLLGSQYYSTHPTFPAGRIAANINIDGGNIWGKTTDLSQIGRGKSTMDALLDAFARQQGKTIKDEEFPDRGFYYRSDQFAFAKIGVPALYTHSGTDVVGKPAGWGKKTQEEWEEKQYHQPSDEIDDSWNFDGMIDDAQLDFFVGAAIANGAAVDWYRGDEFEAARIKAQSAK